MGPHRHKHRLVLRGIQPLRHISEPSLSAKIHPFGDPCGNRTRVTGVRGRCLDRLTNGPGTAFSGFARRGFADGRSKGCRPLDPAWYRLRRFWILKRYAFGMERPAQVLPGGRIGAPSGTRTRDPLIKSQLLYQLS